MTEHFVVMPDGSQYVLATTPPMAAASVWLDASGICKTGGVTVPILSPDAAAVAQTGRLTLTPQYLQPQNFPLPWVLVAVAVVGMGAIALRPKLETLKLLAGGNDEN
jgi:hypothetical protein